MLIPTRIKNILIEIWLMNIYLKLINKFLYWIQVINQRKRLHFQCLSWLIDDNIKAMLQMSILPCHIIHTWNSVRGFRTYYTFSLSGAFIFETKFDVVEKLLIYYVLKLTEIVILWVYYTIPFGLSLFFGTFWASLFNFLLKYFVWLRITDEG